MAQRGEILERQATEQSGDDHPCVRARGVPQRVDLGPGQFAGKLGDPLDEARCVRGQYRHRAIERYAGRIGDTDDGLRSRLQARHTGALEKFYEPNRREAERARTGNADQGVAPVIGADGALGDRGNRQYGHLRTSALPSCIERRKARLLAVVRFLQPLELIDQRGLLGKSRGELLGLPFAYSELLLQAQLGLPRACEFVLRSLYSLSSAASPLLLDLLLEPRQVRLHRLVFGIERQIVGSELLLEILHPVTQITRPPFQVGHDGTLRRSRNRLAGGHVLAHGVQGRLGLHFPVARLVDGAIQRSQSRGGLIFIPLPRYDVKLLAELLELLA